jgi:tetratricopeptide (TPR) repeat protein
MNPAPSGRDWELFLHFLELAQGFTLLFLVCPSSSHAEGAREACTAYLQGQGRALQALPPPSLDDLPGLAGRLVNLASSTHEQALWVSLYPTPEETAKTDLAAWDAALRRTLAGLNQGRNLLALRHDCPVILAGTHALMALCPSSAPDLWSIRSSVIQLGVDSPSLERSELSPHLEAVDAPPAGLADAERALESARHYRHQPGKELECLRYLVRAAEALDGRGRVEKLNKVLKEAVEIANMGNFTDDPGEVSAQFNDLAQCLRNAARLAEAESLYRRALTIGEESYGPNHPTVGVFLSNLADLLRTTNRSAEAEPLSRRALAIAETNYGPNHPTVAIRLNNLALLLKYTNRMAEAEPLFRRALAIAEASYGPNHPNVAIYLSNLASFLTANNRLTEAEPLIRRALAIDEASYGPNHPNVSIRLNNLANLLNGTNRLAEAEPLLCRALAIDEASYGPNHPNVAIRLYNLGTLLYKTNRLAEAEPLFRRALAIDEASYGPNNPELAFELSSLALLLKDTGRLEEAEPLLRRACEIRANFRAQNGYPLSSWATTIRNYRSVLQELNWPPEKIEEALRPFEDPPVA